MRALLPLLLITALTLPGAAPKAKGQRVGPVRTAQQAKAIAEQDTGGRAASARRVPLNGASGGWEVIVRMPGEERGWRCLVDADTRQVLKKTRLDAPGRADGKDGPLHLVKGRG